MLNTQKVVVRPLVVDVPPKGIPPDAVVMLTLIVEFFEYLPIRIVTISQHYANHLGLQK
jgi:hypothetical protein